jgi:hypothetical protein
MNITHGNGGGKAERAGIRNLIALRNHVENKRQAPVSIVMLLRNRELEPVSSNLAQRIIQKAVGMLQSQAFSKSHELGRSKPQQRELNRRTHT